MLFFPRGRYCIIQNGNHYTVKRITVINESHIKVFTRESGCMIISYKRLYSVTTREPKRKSAAKWKNGKYYRIKHYKTLKNKEGCRYYIVFVDGDTIQYKKKHYFSAQGKNAD